MAHKFKIGDKLKVVNVNSSCSCLARVGCDYFIIESVYEGSGGNNGYRYVCYDKKGDRLDSCSGCLDERHFDYYSSSIYKNMNIIEKAVIAFKSEPEKSFIKAGIIDSSGMPTTDGIKLVVGFLLKDKDFAPKFKTDMVDAILAEVETENK